MRLVAPSVTIFVEEPQCVESFNEEMNRSFVFFFHLNQTNASGKFLFWRSKQPEPFLARNSFGVVDQNSGDLCRVQNVKIIKKKRKTFDIFFVNLCTTLTLNLSHPVNKHNMNHEQLNGGQRSSLLEVSAPDLVCLPLSAAIILLCAALRPARLGIGNLWRASCKKSCFLL